VERALLVPVPSRTAAGDDHERSFGAAAKTDAYEDVIVAELERVAGRPPRDAHH
jgi:hypothetical protein